MGAGQVCSPWRSVARTEPELWRRVEVRSHATNPPSHVAAPSHADLFGLAVRLAAGQCEAFCGEGAVDARVISVLADEAPLLKSLRIISVDSIADVTLSRAVANFGQLEELELSLCPGAYPRTCAAVGIACPRLKHLRLNKDHFSLRVGPGNCDDEAMAIATMHGLRSLQLFGNQLSDAGLTAILDGCTRLETLDIRHCNIVKMGAAADKIRARRCGIERLRLPGDSTSDYHLDFSDPDDITRPWAWGDQGDLQGESYLGSWYG